MRDSKHRIGIVNWDKHQRQVGRTRRDWVAVDTEMLADVEIRALKPDLFKCWIGLLLHAGKVGNNFHMSPAVAKDLFGLRRPPRFDLLQERGLITIDESAPEKQVLRGKRVAPENKVMRGKRVAPENEVIRGNPEIVGCRFEEFWNAYPLKKNKVKAKQVWQKGNAANFNSMTDVLIADVLNRAENERGWLDGYTPHATTYLNGKRWQDDIELPRNAMTKTKAAMREFMK